MKRVCVLGSGAFGTAIACLLADNGCHVNIWCRENELKESINTVNINNIYLPDIKLSKNIFAFTDIGQAIDGCEIIFEAVPVKFLRSVLLACKPYFDKEQVWVCASKGIENVTLLFPSQIIDSVFCAPDFDSCGEVGAGSAGCNNIAGVKKVVISGPSFARELAQKQITAIDLACVDQDLAQQVSKILVNNYFKVNITQDIFGVQIGGALKNVVAIAMGMLEGMGYKNNTKALLLNMCLHEMVELAQVFGAQKDTLFGLSGLADLVATCAGGTSKNFKFGHDLAYGLVPSSDILKTTFALGTQDDSCNCNKSRQISEICVLPEGVNTAESVYQIIQVFKNLGTPECKLNNNIFFGDKLIIKNCAGLNFPVLEAIHDIIFGLKSAQDLVLVLMRK